MKSLSWTSEVWIMSSNFYALLQGERQAWCLETYFNMSFQTSTPCMLVRQDFKHPTIWPTIGSKASESCKENRFSFSVAETCIKHNWPLALWPSQVCHSWDDTQLVAVSRIQKTSWTWCALAFKSHAACNTSRMVITLLVQKVCCKIVRNCGNDDNHGRHCQ